MSDKALFLPLATEHYIAFENRTKRYEMRLHGKRWNKTTCYTGRNVVLSCGYGKHRRMRGTIKGITITELIYLEPQRQELLRQLFGLLLSENLEIIMIEIGDLRAV